jgi:hypothetical protein
MDSKNPLRTGMKNGVAERNITAKDLKQHKSAMDNTRNYVSGDKEWSSSSYQFYDSSSKKS